MIKKIKGKSKDIPLSDFVNVDTGELLSSEVGSNTRITVDTKSDQFTVASKEFMVVDSEALRYLFKTMSRADVEKALMMSNMTKTEFNILFSATKPHTIETLAEALNFSVNELLRVIKRLESKNVLAYCVCYPSGYKQKIYMMNPTFSRKRKTLNTDLLNFFKDLSKQE